MTTRGSDQMLSRIGFTEGWLARARRQWTDGNRTRSLLTLVLADAELRHAMETAGERTCPVQRPAWVRWALVGAVVACGLFLVGRWSAAPDAVATTPSVSTIRALLLPSGSQRDAATLSAPTRSLLTSVRSVPLRPAPASSVAQPGPVPNRMNSPAASRPAGNSAVSPSSRPTLLDLVLTAERVLRQDPAGSSLP